MPSDQPAAPYDEAFWRDYLTRGDSMERRARRVLRFLPHGPRCKLCLAPFGGAGAPLMRAIGKRPADKNSSVCQSCFTFMEKHHGGAEIEASFLFADIRGSTTLAEQMPLTDFHDLIDRFHHVATQAVIDNDGGVDKFVGDEIVAFFFPLMTGDRHAVAAVDAAVGILEATGHRDPDGPWAPVGAGVGTGLAWVGAVGDGMHTDLTALGDVVNTTARLASVATAGEVLVTGEAAAAAGLDPALDVRSLALKGKQDATRVVSLAVAPQQAGVH